MIGIWMWVFGRLIGRRSGKGFFWVFLACAALWLFACGVGLSLICYWSISVAPVRGGTYFLCRRKER
jgi:hypothetical protein